MIGGLLALVSAVTFAYANASVRRGVLTGTVLQAVAISLPVALPVFVIAMLMTGGFQLVAGFSSRSFGLLALAGVVHFAWARHCNYRATKAIGANLVAPLQQFSLVITLVLAVFWLGEKLTILRIVGIVLVFLGPVLTLKRKTPAKDSSVNVFNPQYAEGYFYALLSSLGFGVSPILIGMAFDNKSIAAGIAGVFVSYVAAMLGIALVLLLPGRWQSFRSLDTTSRKWFVLSGIAVGFSQMFRYMALAIAPVSVVSPIQRLSLVFRIYLGWLINPQHEVFGGRVIWGTVLSLIGAVALSVSADGIVHSMPIPRFMGAVLAWRWP
jgi:uncharacterized membrane protein